MNSSSCICIAVIHYLVAQKVPADCASWRPGSDTSHSGKARCGPLGFHVKDHAPIPTPPADPVHTVTLQAGNTFGIHRHRIVPPNKHRVAPQVSHSIPTWAALGIILENKYLILPYAAATACWERQSDHATCVPPDLVQVTLAGD
uniref:Secreted protein n=1 Tax=Triticum urartu TaxID=4572 RepID=A0A8R7TBB2_TRIUA